MNKAGMYRISKQLMRITLLWNPYSTNNIYYRSWRHWFIKPKPKAQKEHYILQARTQKTEFYESEVEVEVYLYFWDKRKRDIDNYNKLWMDALSWVIYNDDKQITKMYLEKRYDKQNPRIELILKQI